MTEQEQQIALCEWIGYTKTFTTDGVFKWWLNPEGKYCNNLPNTSSLDVLHDMEKRVSNRDKVLYWNHLCRAINPDIEWEDWGVLNCCLPMLCATAAQRREALLRTIGKWRE